MELKDLAIYGAGGLGREVACVVERINRKTPTWNFLGFFDDGHPCGTDVSHFGKILGGIAELNAWPRPLDVALCFGSPRALRAVSQKITNPLVEFHNIIVPTFWVSDPQTLRMGHGNIIAGDTIVTTDITIGNFNVFNGSVILGHDVVVGDCNVIMHAVHISGNVKIGDCNLFGTNSFVKQSVKIGNDVTLSPLSALLTKPKDGNTYIGNPAKIFKF